MRTRLLAFTVIALAIGGFLPPSATFSATTHARIIVAPDQGHPGAAAYLSGSGFPPHRQLKTTFWCSNTRASVAHWVHGSFSGSQPTADARGQFLAYRFVPPAHVAPLPADCTINATAARSKSSSAVQASARYTVLPTTRPLSPCATHICLTIKASLVRLKSGAQGNIVIHGWPGASSSITIQVPSRTTQRKLIRLNWRGTGALKTLVAPGLKLGLKSRIQVRATLGRYSGSKTAHFIVIPGGR